MNLFLRTKIMKRIVFVIFFLIISVSVLSSCFGPDKNELINEKIKKIETGLLPSTGFMSILQPATPDAGKKMILTERMEHYKVPSVCIAVINDFEVEWVRNYGIFDKKRNVKVSENILFEAGSTTKFLTAAAVLHMVGKGLIDLDEDINNKLKDWKIPDNEFTEHEKVTLRRLLSHRSGLNRPNGGFSFEGSVSPSVIQVLKGESPAENDPAAVGFVPGSNWNYSNIGFVVIQKLLQDVTGEKYADIMQKTVFNPAGMKISTFDQQYTEEKYSNRARPHDTKGEPKDWFIQENAVGHGGLWTTPSDLARFTIEIMKSFKSSSDKILSQKSQEEMFKKEMEFPPKQFFGITGQGLGVFIIDDEENMYFTHPGTNNPGAVCALIGNPESGDGAVIMSNGIGAELLHLEILAGIAAEYNWPKINYKTE